MPTNSPQSTDRCRKSPGPTKASGFLSGRHGLLLHRVHAAEPADALLIQLDRSAVRRSLNGCGPQGIQFVAEPRQKRCLQLLRNGIRHGAHRKSRTGTLQDRIIAVVVDPITRLRMRLWP